MGKLHDQVVPYKAAQCLLRACIGKNLALIINWEGSGGTKIPFEHSKLLQVMSIAIKRKFGEKTKMNIVYDKIKIWLYNSSTRLKK